MSVVYLAEHVRLGRRVALKLLSPELAGSERFRDRFLRESRLAASLDHPNIVPIYDADEVDDVLFIAMRYVEGSDLKEAIRAPGTTRCRPHGGHRRPDRERPGCGARPWARPPGREARQRAPHTRGPRVRLGLRPDEASLIGERSHGHRAARRDDRLRRPRAHQGRRGRRTRGRVLARLRGRRVLHGARPLSPGPRGRCPVGARRGAAADGDRRASGSARRGGRRRLLGDGEGPERSHGDRGPGRIGAALGAAARASDWRGADATEITTSEGASSREGARRGRGRAPLPSWPSAPCC
jgi:Protein kinase domain